MSHLNKLIHAMQFNKKKQSAFLEDIATLIRDGVNIKEAIATLETVNTGIDKQVAATINQSIAEGQSIAHGFINWFPTTTVEIIHAGEQSGTLADALESAAQALKNQDQFLSTISSTLIYPSLVFVLSLIMLVVIKKTVLNNFSAIKPIASWPSQGASLYHLAEFIEYWWWALLCLIFLCSFLLFKFLTTYTGKSREKVDKVPLLDLYRDSIAARFMQTLGLLITNGIIIRKALNIMSLEAQPYLAWHLVHMEYHLSGGMDNIAEVLDTHLIRQEDLTRLKVIAKGKGFAAALISLAAQSQKRNQRNATLIVRLLGALLLILAATVAANIIFGIYSIGSALT